MGKRYIYIYIYIYTEFWWGKLKERDKVENIGVGGRLILNGS